MFGNECVSDFKIPVIHKATTMTTPKLACYTLKVRSYPKPDPNSTNLNKLLPFCREYYNKLFECRGSPHPVQNNCFHYFLGAPVLYPGFSTADRGWFKALTQHCRDESVYVRLVPSGETRRAATVYPPQQLTHTLSCQTGSRPQG